MQLGKELGTGFVSDDVQAADGEVAPPETADAPAPEASAPEPEPTAAS
jgi:hypothetical protein